MTERCEPQPHGRGGVRELLRQGAAFLRVAGIEEAWLNAENLLAAVTGLDRAALHAHPERPIEDELVRRYGEFLGKRAAHAPLQYVVGRVPFIDFELKVDARALIPRPETELLVEVALECVSAADAPIVCDVGTGCGNIAIALARALSCATVLATDISPRALELACENAVLCGVAERIRFLCGDLLSPLAELGERFDLMCSNPPYVSEKEFSQLAPEVRDYEPRIALLASEDGTEFHRRLISGASRFLKVGGYLVLELPAGKASRIAALTRGAGQLRVCKIVRDCSGIERVMVLRAHSHERS